MTDLLAPVTGSSAVHRINPVAKLAAAVILDVSLILSIDWVSALVALACELPLFFFAGVGWRTFWARTAAVWIAAPLTAVSIALYGQQSGRVYAEFFVARVSDGSLSLALATALRVLAIGLPSVVLFLTIDPTDLADGLAQILHLPSRFVLGALAAMRLVGLFMDDWRSLALARRARGVGDQNRLRRILGQAFALLVLSVRRGSSLATAMEARGFGGRTPRTWARQSRLRGPDIALMIAGAAIGAAAITISVFAGQWRFIGGG